MVKKLFVILALIGVAYLFFNLINNYQIPTELNKTAAYYAVNTEREVGAANVVSAIVVTYRGLDTLGEVTILFLTASIIGFFLKRKTSIIVVDNAQKSSIQGQKTSELLITGTHLLVPFMFLFGIYIFVNGHLTPGGGFQGGAVIASGMALMILSGRKNKINAKVLAVVESFSGIFYVVIGILGIVLAGGFLDNRILPLGNFGSLFSAGALPVIYVFIGLKVGTEIASILLKIHSEADNDGK